MNISILLLAAAGVVSFKDANKIRSWDAWGDHKAQAAVTNVLQKEKRSVTWERLNKVDPGLREIGCLQTRTSDQVKSSKWSVGCETLDRDYADWESYRELLPMLGVKRARFFSGWAKTEQEKGSTTLHGWTGRSANARRWESSRGSASPTATPYGAATSGSACA